MRADVDSLSFAEGSLAEGTLPFSPQPAPLGHADRGFRGRVHAIETEGHSHSLPASELEQRLIELGFIEGAMIEILHEGFFGRDPIAVRVNQATIALRRREAMAILVV